MKEKDVLLKKWDAVLTQKRDTPAIFATNREVALTFGQIEERAREIEAKMPAVKPHNVSAIQIGNHDDWPSHFLACLRRQRVILPIDESVSKQQAEAAVSIAAKSGITDWGDKPPTLFKLTSGTTAAPRMIRFRSEQILADCDQICDTMEISDVDLNFGVIPISHSYGFSSLLTPLIARGVSLVLSQDRTPRAVVEDLAKTNATVFPGTRIFYQAFCEMENVPPLPKLRLCISAGAPLPVATAKKFRERFGLPIHSFYGASECGGICYDREAKNEVEGFVGAPMKDVDLEMLDPNAEQSRGEGRSGAAGDGYFPAPAEEQLGNCGFSRDYRLSPNGSWF